MFNIIEQQQIDYNHMRHASIRFNLCIIYDRYFIYDISLATIELETAKHMNNQKTTERWTNASI